MGVQRVSEQDGENGANVVNEEKERREAISDQVDRAIFLAKRATLAMDDADPFIIGTSRGVSVSDAFGRSVLDFSQKANLSGHLGDAVVHALGEQSEVGIGTGPMRNSLTRIQSELAYRIRQLLMEESRYEDPRMLPATSGEDALRMATDALNPRGVATFAGQSFVHGGHPRTILPSGQDDADIVRKKLGESGADVVVIEPVMRDGRALSPALIGTVVEYVRNSGSTLIVDESLSGLYRCDGLLAQTAHSDISPGLTILGGGLGGGMPLGLVISEGDVSASVRDGFSRFRGDFAAHPMSCAASLAILNSLGSFVGDIVHALDAHMRVQMDSLGVPYSGQGLLWGIPVESEEIARQKRKEAADRGLLVDIPRESRRTLVLTPPLSVTQDEITAAVDVLFEVL